MVLAVTTVTFAQCCNLLEAGLHIGSIVAKHAPDVLVQQRTCRGQNVAAHKTTIDVDASNLTQNFTNEDCCTLTQAKHIAKLKECCAAIQGKGYGKKSESKQAKNCNRNSSGGRFNGGRGNCDSSRQGFQARVAALEEAAWTGDPPNAGNNANNGADNARGDNDGPPSNGKNWGPAATRTRTIAAQAV